MKQIATGTNDCGESVIVITYSDKIVIRTMQDNNWVRINIYWNNGDVEEIYEH